MDLLALIKSPAHEDQAITQLIELLTPYAADLDFVDVPRIARSVTASRYEGMQQSDILDIALLNARPHTDKHYQYSTFCARIFNEIKILADVQYVLNIDSNVSEQHMLAHGLRHAKRCGLLDVRLLDGRFDLDRLEAAIVPERSHSSDLLAVSTLYDRYFMHDQGRRFETIQTMKMRVAMGISVREADPTTRAIEAYDLLSLNDYMSSTPTLFNAGTKRPQLSSCYLTSIDDDLEAIYDAMKDNALLSKWAGGLGNDWSRVRALNAYIAGTNGKSQGTVPFLKVANDTAVAVNQGGKRKGACCAYLTTWHLDIEEFVELRKNTGDDRRRTHDMNTANWIPDEFMIRVFNDQTWTLFTPNEVPELNELYGQAFSEQYRYYEENAKNLGLLHKVVNAKDLWRKMLSMVFETGHPWITFKDPCNIRSPQSHVGVVRSSNLCTEITLNTSNDEIAVCNLGSINLPQHIVNGKLDLEKLERTVRTAVRMLDNVIDVNFYPVEKAETSNLKHRPIGLGIMGFQDALYKQGIAYNSDAAVQFADESMEYISYFAISASADLAEEHGSYPSFEGSTWSKGMVPLDTIQLLRDSRPAGMMEMDTDSVLGQAKWDALRARVKNGMRNSNVMAIAPTATISNICTVSQSIEPTFENLYVKSNLSGEFTIINRYLIDELLKLGLWNEDMAAEIKRNDGSVKSIESIPADIRNMFLTAFEMNPKYLVLSAAKRQKWIDQAQSLNLYIAQANGKKLDMVYKMAWLNGLKTTYYLRAKGASTTEKSTGSTHLNAVSAGGDFSVAAAVPKACSIENPECEACQ